MELSTLFLLKNKQFISNWANNFESNPQKVNIWDLQLFRRIEDPVACLPEEFVSKRRQSALPAQTSRNSGSTCQGKSLALMQQVTHFPRHIPVHRTPSPWVTKQVFLQSRQNGFCPLSPHKYSSHSCLNYNNTINHSYSTKLVTCHISIISYRPNAANQK